MEKLNNFGMNCHVFSDLLKVKPVNPYQQVRKDFPKRDGNEQKKEKSDNSFAEILKRKIEEK
jgi:hypothetical protein